MAHRGGMIDNCLRQGALNTSNTSRQTKSGAEANRNRSTTHYGRVNRSVQVRVGRLSIEMNMKFYLSALFIALVAFGGTSFIMRNQQATATAAPAKLTIAQ
jgi:hypothetical protein